MKNVVDNPPAVIPNLWAGISAGVRNPPERTGNLKSGDSSHSFGMTDPDETTVVFGMTAIKE